MKVLPKSLICFLTTGLLFQLGATAQAAETDQREAKSEYTLFHPTPEAQMREFNTDRPDRTEGPFTVDAGHFQIESDIISFTQDHQGSVKTHEIDYLTSNLRLGLTNNLDFHVIFTPDHSLETKDNGVTTKTAGFGDTTLRLKYNFMGNDGGDIAVGLIPFIKVPTDVTSMGNHVAESGVILPIAINLPHDWDMGFMVEYDHNKNGDTPGFHNEMITSLTTGHEIFKDFRVYGEIYNQSSDEPEAAVVATFDVGVTYLVAKNLQLDLGANMGITPAADDFNPFLGISARF